MPDTLLSRRKSEHLQIVADQDVAYTRGTLLNNIQIPHQALPELSIDDIDMSVKFFGKSLKAPLMITSMTGGAEFAGKLNHSLAEVAQDQGIAFAVGSQRIMLRHPEVTADFTVRSKIPDGVLLGNIGAVQLQEYSSNTIAGLVDAIEADGICVHLNAAQELMQDEGHRDFKGLTEKIAQLVESLDGRVVVKETGAGLSPETLKQLKSIGVSYIDVSGAGGTSWTKVEAYRATDPSLRRLGEAFSDWGVPTAFCIIAARQILKDKAFLIGSGGILSGLDAARSIIAGADIAGFARPALLAFLQSGTDGVIALIESFTKELKTAMLLTGSGKISALKNAPRIYTGELRDWLSTYNWSGGEEIED
ncbi:MAG: type 2 isopentenyl-diphosphate Delta-isomerase [candidate division Zixibacteria bacterium]|nr:type 2 isopentenyl-diphosphate Delta-isomerase [candidate division Zixibacteria bacterium]